MQGLLPSFRDKRVALFNALSKLHLLPVDLSRGRDYSNHPAFPNATLLPIRHLFSYSTIKQCATPDPDEPNQRRMVGFDHPKIPGESAIFRIFAGKTQYGIDNGLCYKQFYPHLFHLFPQHDYFP
jgi:hypothetical protein